MTVSYNLDVSSAGSFTFLKILAKWKGSIFKSVYCELLGWIVGYYIVHVIYRFALDKDQQILFDKVVGHLDSRLVYIPLTFMLGFFVTIVIDRWRNILLNISFIENCALSVASLVRGRNNEVRLIRRTIVRYLVLSQVLVFRDISMRVRRRFPNLESLIDAGFVFEDELRIINDFSFDYNKYWMPIGWANSLICRSKFIEEGKVEKAYIDSPQAMNQLLNTIKEYRSSLEYMFKYDWVPIPIAYPQVVFLAVRVYFVICLFSRQYSIHDDIRDQVNMIFPIMTVLEFVFFVGWMKVAEALLNPLGEDDDDLECNWLIDKNIATGLAIVDTNYDVAPTLKLDVFADPTWKPVYSEESVSEAPVVNRGGSVANVELHGANERVKMVHVEPQCEPIRKSSDIRRKLTTALNYRPRSSSIIHPVVVVDGKKTSEDSPAASPYSTQLAPLEEEETVQEEIANGSRK